MKAKLNESQLKNLIRTSLSKNATVHLESFLSSNTFFCFPPNLDKEGSCPFKVKKGIECLSCRYNLRLLREKETLSEKEVFISLVRKYCTPKFLCRLEEKKRFLIIKAIAEGLK